MGGKVYIDQKDAGPHSSALDSEAEHAARNAALAKESNKAF